MDHAPPADWRRADQYSALHKAGRQGFAWEWLRRKPAYRAACDTEAGEGGSHLAHSFGLHRLEPCCRSVPLARPVWRADTDPHVLLATAQSASIAKSDAFDVGSVTRLATCHRCAEGQEHWLFSDGFRSIRLDLIVGSLSAGSVDLNYHLAGLATVLPRLTALHRFIAFATTGSMPNSLFRPETKAQRWTLVLRTADAIAAGASQRDIAQSLLGVEPGPRWRIASPSLRRRAQRLVEAARRAMGADPRHWLNGQFP